MERSRRQGPVSQGKAKAKSALEQLKAQREGGHKRLDNYEVKEEEALYDVVDEQQYAQLVSKRRQEAGNFIVGQDSGYADIGEDDYWR